MISSVLAGMLLLAANPTADTREAYARCLKDFGRKAAEEKMDAAAFDAGIASACKDKEALLKTALINADVGMGLKRAAAEKSTAEQIADYLSMAKEDYRAGLADVAPAGTPAPAATPAVTPAAATTPQP